MTLHHKLVEAVKTVVSNEFNVTLENVEITLTRKDQNGDLTVMVFPMLRHIKGNPAVIGEHIGAQLLTTSDLISSYEVIKGFLNITLADAALLSDFNSILAQENYGSTPVDDSQSGVMVEYSSPNTNKPLHLGHIRNNLLGYSVAQIIAATGRTVNKTQIINDRGIHICKSMLAWEKFGNGETPQSTGLKGDKFVGNYYVKFNNVLKTELQYIFKLATSEYKEIRNESKIDAESLKRLKIDSKVKLVSQAYERALNKYLLYKDIIGHDKLLKLNSLKKSSDLITRNHTKESINKQVKKFNQGTNLVTNYILNKKIKFPNANSKIIFKIILNEISNLTPIQKEAQQLLKKWEQGDDEVVALWKKMNGWVYEGFDTTYKNLGVDFDSLYYESNTYLLGKDVVQIGLDKGVFERDPDGSVWIDLTDEGLDRKIVLRSDGTAVYMTQDIGTAIQRVKDHDINAMVYTVGNEQDYHFKVLFLILKKLGYEWAANLYHLSYGMVELPSGKMKSREGTVVDADDLMEEMTATAREIAMAQGKLDGMSDTDKARLYKMIGLGALKYFMLKVDPKKSMMFDPQESVDFQGNTGPFIQYAHARIQSILKKSGYHHITSISTDLSITDKDKSVIKVLQQYSEVIHNAAKNYSPALIANYVYELVKEFNSFYQNVPKIVEESDDAMKQFRLALCYKTAATIKHACSLLGIEVPDQM